MLKKLLYIHDTCKNTKILMKQNTVTIVNINKEGKQWNNIQMRKKPHLVYIDFILNNLN